MQALIDLLQRTQYRGVNFSLMTTFPKKELLDSQDVVAAGLVGAIVFQKLVV